MKKLKEYLTVYREFEYEGTLSDFKLSIENAKGFRFDKINSKEYIFYPMISYGTIFLRGLLMKSGIKVWGDVEVIEDQRLKIIMSTFIRFEHYILVFLFLFLLAIVPISVTPINYWLYPILFGLWLVAHIWFQFIYALQQNALIDLLVKKFKLKEV